MTDTVLIARDSRDVVTVTLNNPSRRNAFDDNMITTLRRHFLDVALDDSVRALVLRGSGGHFSGGGDLNWMRRMVSYDFARNVEDARALAGMFEALYRLPCPTIAEVRGAAFGGAVGLVSCCDMAVAATDSVFSLSEVKIGLIPATISPYVIRAIGERACSQLFLTGERFDAERALRLGLVGQICTAETLEARREILLKEVLGGGPAAVRSAKRLLRNVANQELDHTLIEDTCQAIAEIRISGEGQAGLTAFLEKKPPPWRVDGD